ncbi:MAG: hypothetical protein EZS28_039476 [Streblomastix strix]|uniref:Uncharacterized protein n=1 Tax=Streblomastix strix TaxID=222440 RepID=A0A5J4U3W7_9EUKA|nr:MAG: hypothetical protein EZS28_039476 [Streblomastix strix]
MEPKKLIYTYLRKLIIRLNNMRQEEQEIQRSVQIHYCSFGLIVYIGIMGWILNTLRTFFDNLIDIQQINDESVFVNSLLREIATRGAIAYSFKHAVSTELAGQGLETTKLNTVFCTILVGSRGQTNATQTISQQIDAVIERNGINTLPVCDLYHSGNSMLSRNSIAQPLALPFNETLSVGRGIKPTDNTRARSDMIYFDQHHNDHMSRQQDQ